MPSYLQSIAHCQLKDDSSYFFSVFVQYEESTFLDKYPFDVPA